MRRKLLGVGKVVVGLGASGGLGWLAVRGLDWGLVLEQLRGVSVSLLVLAIAVFMAASVLRAFRWQILFVNQRISVLRLFIIQNEGIGLNNVVPVRVVSEAAQLAILSIRDKVPGATALATLGMERVVDVIASTLILAVAFFLVPEMSNFKPYVWGAVGITLVLLALVKLVAWGGNRVSIVRRVAFLSAFATAVKDLERERVRLAASLSVSVVYWIMVGITAWIIAAAVDLPISPMTATLVIMGTIFFATAVPAAPGAIGTFEFAVVYVLDYFGVAAERGFRLRGGYARCVFPAAHHHRRHLSPYGRGCFVPRHSRPCSARGRRRHWDRVFVRHSCAERPFPSRRDSGRWAHRSRLLGTVVAQSGSDSRNHADLYTFPYRGAFSDHRFNGYGDSDSESYSNPHAGARRDADAIGHRCINPFGHSDSPLADPRPAIRGGADRDQPGPNADRQPVVWRHSCPGESRRHRASGCPSGGVACSRDLGPRPGL